jgi:hypothetical protein
MDFIGGELCASGAARAIHFVHFSAQFHRGDRMAALSQTETEWRPGDAESAGRAV